MNAENLKPHYLHLVLYAKSVNILSPSTRMPALLQYRIPSFYLKV